MSGVPAIFDIRTVLGPATPIIRIAAIGALPLGDEGEPYDELMKKGLCAVIGFEPVREACDRLNELHGPTHRYLPFAIGDGSRRSFHRTAYPMNSSLYPPNQELLRKFQGLSEMFEIVGVEEVDTVRLDDVPDIGDIDFVKVDVQGGELDVFRGAAHVLRGAVAVQTEVEFAPLYVGQPLFGDIDVALRQAGFLLHKTTGAMGRAFRPLVSADGPGATLSQILWSDFIYVRDFTRLAELKPRKLLALATVLHEVFRSVDFCALVLHAHDKLTGRAFWSAYLTQLTGAPPPEAFEE
jgi:FkbM family methyltransferase